MKRKKEICLVNKVVADEVSIVTLAPPTGWSMHVFHRNHEAADLNQFNPQLNSCFISQTKSIGG